MTDPIKHPPLAADDPRISEWIDGRLPAGEAAEVERAVAESPALIRLVTDLRAIKEAARMARAASPPPGFTDRVMAAVAAGANDRDPDRAVDDEWRAIEAERIAVERAEAAADLDEAAKERPDSPAGRRWPWLALAGALAAGLIVALTLDREGDRHRDVAMVTPQRSAPRRTVSEPPAPAAVAAKRAEAGRDADTESGAAAEAAVPLQDDRLRSAAPAEEQAADVDVAAGLAFAAQAHDESFERRKRGPGGDRERLSAPLGAAAPPAANLAAARVSGRAAPAGRVVIIVVGSPRKRAELVDRIRALGLEGDEAADKEREEKAAAADDLVELVGPAEVVRAFLIELESWNAQRPTSEAPNAARDAEPAKQSPAEEERERGRVFLRIIEEAPDGDRPQP